MLRKVFGFRRKPGEGHAQYMMRTARIIESSFEQTKIIPLHCRVLREVFRNAWRERCMPLRGERNYLHLARQFRTREWWETVRMMGSERKRRKEGIVHSGMGYRIEWEDIFVSVFGIAWRARRDECSREAEWMALYPAFESHLCTLWGLFCKSSGRCSDRQDQVHAAPKRRRIATHPLDELPAGHGDSAPDVHWGGMAGRVLFITDCKPLAGVVNGTTVLAAPSLGPVFDRITKSMFNVMGYGWRPAQDADDMVVWHKRDWNIKADFLVNYTMDEKKSWYHSFPIESVDLSGANFLIHSDGGTRAASCSAAAWCVEAVTRRGLIETTTLFIIAGTFISDPISSFTAEALALEEAAKAVEELIYRIGERPSGF
ncbi:unnamed protein product [Prorocentrum cordatum]|uniref:Uncharacterized protein n=1 Tax=Prorocentrum cordatum TaxID=2364126 RepID=A0ABN9XSM0_9DINO|nr:unnamed protein product [Polarella glacialis]